MAPDMTKYIEFAAKNLRSCFDRTVVTIHLQYATDTMWFEVTNNVQ